MNKVFVYGTLKEGYTNHKYYLKDNSKFVKKYITPPEFTMLDVMPYPYLVHVGDTQIHGEIYEIDDKTLRNLDRLEGYHEHAKEQSHYVRETIDVPDVGQVFVYVQNTKKTYEELDKQYINKTGIWHNERLKING